ncbi:MULTISPECIES: 6-phosphogluconolactonase [unclassified Aureimonas]|uniref:6-phosphogluconolactonase n=1 Tax=unclassified Aureimonas TaxID=2615206 RepID=UPI0006FF780A|nr:MULTISPECIES: 6-phosphogluconolactonase [unclassified Aureimonas]KQT69801.1 6-phosphogluconolactonase [Aureimonas sp. Leaf427]KQT76047.1 6-phosphogluconolactonase [Aureimonas sp. Leaf460]
MNSVFHRYESREALAEALAAGVAAVLVGGIATTGAATLAVSGGSTPKLFLETLGRAEIDWSAVTVTLVDERWVPADHARSNAGFLARHFLKGPAAAARFEPLYAETETPEESLSDLTARIGGLHHPFDAVILGMGADGHTASFFPGADKLAEAIDPANHSPLAVLRAEGAGEPRISLTLARLVDAHFLALHIEGDEKLAVLETAKGDGPVEDLPVRSVLRAPREEPLQVFWTPAGAPA